MIPLGQKNTLAEYMILSGVDNRPPILDKDLYDSWKSRMELYIQNRENRRMILESVENGPLVWPMIEKNGVTMTKKYAELFAIVKIQADYDMKETNIILQGLPTNIYSLVNHHRVSKDLWERVQLLMQDTSLTKRKKQFQVNTKFLNSLPPTWSKFMTDVKLVRDLHTTNYDQLHAYLEQHELQANEERQNSCAAGTLGTRANTLGTGGSYSGQQRVVKCFNCQREGKGKVLNEEELEFLADLDVAEVLMENLSSYGSSVLSEVPYYDNTHNDMLNQIVQEILYSEQTHLDINSSAQQDVFEQLLNQVANCNKVNEDNLIANETLSAKLERYKEWVKLLEERPNVDLEKESLTKTFNAFKNESKEKEARNIDKEIDVEKKVKELDNIVCKMGQSAQTVHMITKPQVFYDNNLKQVIGFQNPFYLKKA
uniref:Integrase, catalytic region, zinc finger, CCHC-type, peptidase aspartic, catalytic n=1 Tax=Tanacetum cinerariifolium TaxID=118510 RepID=A0A6L2LIZ5_TANCI|nr:hypothetical protein [Tanacetum cinerariifolium]